jgi:hypothetical protein
MKSQISRYSHDPAKRYSSVFQQQGRMITDADWNELQAIVKARLDEALRDVVGGGVPSHRPLSLRFNGANLEIVPGVLYAGGVPARLGNPGDAAFTYANQPDFLSPPGPVASGDLIYVDAWEREVSFFEDPNLQDPGLNGADTCTRTQTMLQIKRAPTGLSPELTIEADARNPAVGNALLGIGLRRAQSSADILDPAADEVAIDQPIGNFLFRVEVHDVQGPANNPTSITLKWSSENAAEACASGTAPPDFKGSDWAYEFHGPASERQLGVHLVSVPARRPLDDGYPTTEPDKGLLPWVRRWDGFCVLTRPNTSADWTTANIAGGKDRGVALSSGIADGVHGHAAILPSPATGTPTSLVLRLNLQLIDLQLHLKGKSFVAGDHWLAMARDQFVSGQQLLDSKPPLGVVHRYLLLGKVTGPSTALVFQPDRQLAFSPLAELVLDSAGNSGARRIGAEAIQGSPSALPAGTVNSQLTALLNLSNTSTQRDDLRYLRRAGSVTVTLDNATPKAVFTSLNPPAAALFTYSDFEADGVTVKVSQQYVNGPKTSQIEVRIDKDNQKGFGGITTDTFWHHVFVTNKTSPLAKVQVNLEIYMIAAPATPEKGGTMEGKDTSNEKSAQESAKAAKEAKENKDNPDKASKESKEGKENTEKTAKESKEGKESSEKTSKDTKDNKDNPDKASKESKESKDNKEGKEGKENKENKENKESKEHTKESKEKEASKDQKENKEDKESKDRDDKVRDKGHIGTKEIETPAPAPGLPASLLAAPLLDLAPCPLPTDQRAFIRSDERPPVGDDLARRSRAEPPPP